MDIPPAPFVRTITRSRTRAYAASGTHATRKLAFILGSRDLFDPQATMPLTTSLPETMWSSDWSDYEYYHSTFETWESDCLAAAASCYQLYHVALSFEKTRTAEGYDSTTPDFSGAGFDEMCWPRSTEQLLSYEVPIEDRNRRGDSALHVAFVNDETSPIVDTLLGSFLPAARENVTNRDGLSFLHIAAAKASYDDVMDLLRRFPFDVDCQVSMVIDSQYAGYTPLHFAVHHGNLAAADALLQHGADFCAPDRYGSTPLHLALDRSHANMIDLILLKDRLHHNRVNDSGVTHFMAACAGGSTSVVGEFLDVAEQKPSELAALIDAPVADAQHHLAGYTPMHFAALSGNLATVQLLLEYGASPAARTRFNATPLDVARSLGYEKICELLRRAGGDESERYESMA